MQVLVTGALGFIGSHVCEHLLGRGDNVIAVDNLDAYYPVANKRRNLRELAQHPRSNALQWVQADIRDRERMFELFETHRFDAVAHLAAMAGVRYSEQRAPLYTDVNVQGTLNLLDAARQQSMPGPFVLASTSSVYGSTNRIPFEESDPCDRPLAPYPASKRSAELYGHSYHHLFKLNVTVLRFFTVYGPRNRPDMMAHMLLDNLLGGSPVQLYNNGEMWRDWTFVDDTAAGVVAALSRPQGFATFNLGRGEPVLLKDFVRRLEELTDAPARLQSAPVPPSDMQRTFADIERARRQLGYEPKTTLAQGTAALYRWYLNRDALPLPPLTCDQGLLT